MSLPNTTFFAGGHVIEPVHLNRTWNTTTVNQLLGLPGMFSTYDRGQLLRLRGIAITSSSMSILAGFAGLYCVLCIDRRRKVFRHQLILFLISCDFLKALVLLIYPVAILIRNQVYGYPAFYNTLGWMTAFTIEGADFAIAIFAIHFALLIFMPSWKWQNNASENMEGGLFRVRRYLYPATFMLPTILASLAFVGFNTFIPVNLNDRVILNNNNYDFPYQAREGGYKAMSAWCYLPPHPLWYRIVLSWGPRYFIIVLIFTIYISIYIFVSRENRKIKNQIGSFRHNDSVDIHRILHYRGKFLSAGQKFRIYLKYFCKKTGLRRFYRTLHNFFFFSFDEDQEEDAQKLSEDGQVGPLAQVLSNQGVLQASPSQTRRTSTKIPKSKLSAGGSNSFSYHFKKRNSHFSNTSPRTPMCRGKISKPTANGSSMEQGRAQDYFSHAPSTGNSPISKSRHLNKNRSKNSVNSNKRDTKSSLPKDDASGSDAGSPSLPELASSGNEMLPTLPLKNSPLEEKSQFQSGQKASNFAVGGSDHVLGLQHNFQSETYQEFKKRRAQIQRQLRSIFIYPFSYVVIWSFPFAVDVIQYNYEIIHGPVIWLEYIATFMQPLSCFVDVLVFLYRERPWRHSWASITTKELYGTYAFKGEIGEKPIREMCNCEMGKKGWYYRGRWSKLECWRNKPQRWKRIAWFCYRFAKGCWRKHFDFEDRCNDAAYWDDYYLGNQKNTHLTHSSKLSCAEAFKEVLDVDNSRRDSYVSSSTGEELYENQGYVRIPLKWRIVHFLPMLNGVDLDQLDYDLRTSQRDWGCDIPGMGVALQNLSEKKTQVSGESFFKPDYDMARSRSDPEEPSDVAPLPHAHLSKARHSSSRLSENTQNTQSPLHSLVSEPVTGQRRVSVINASDDRGLRTIRNDSGSASSSQNSDEGNVSGKRMDLLDFLNG
ncbi:Gpr1p LALA0_S02e09890g [Lachancea lanzarotensis]|uniref:LALA0S02e09890g1_1 n=1 Tax=Lachancea lanzarotensis TaxID=1245769 RepID=A0A0C7MMZ1_9SACH|nr:uncharacterized protein LALA0_S02e09890g [Lachancea lanzarotensis]CEP61240.1 LALA0S02e09890g1_1 [Lachancea lanzarotensis]